MKMACDEYGHCSDIPVIVFTDLVRAKSYIETKKKLYDTYHETRRRNERRKDTYDFLIEFYNNKPPYEEKVRAIGCKPIYDHSRARCKEYNKQHHAKMECWNKLFFSWAKENHEEWSERVKLLVDAEVNKQIGEYTVINEDELEPDYQNDFRIHPIDMDIGVD